MLVIEFRRVNSIKIEVARFNGVEVLHFDEQQQLPQIINVWTKNVNSQAF